MTEKLHIWDREEICCSLTTSIRLKELGAPQNTLHKWYIIKDSILKGSTGYKKENLSSDRGEVPYSYLEKDKVKKEEKVYAAYTAEEILSILPEQIKKEEGTLSIRKQNGEYFCYYPFFMAFQAKTLVEALCQQAISLFESGILKHINQVR